MLSVFMKIGFKNLGPLQECEVELGDLTIITGHNNTGKTFVTYGVYGLLSDWRRWLRLPLPKTVLAALRKKGEATYDLEAFAAGGFQEPLARMGRRYQQYISRVLAADPERCTSTTVQIEMSQPPTFARKETLKRKFFFDGGVMSLERKVREKTIKIAIHDVTGRNIVTKTLNEAAVVWLTQTIKRFLFGAVFPPVYIASTERTGGAIFQRELYLGRNRLDELAAGAIPPEKDDESERPGGTVSYASAVQRNVEFLSLANLEGLQRQRGQLAAERPDLLVALDEIVGGTFRTNKEGVSFAPGKQRSLKLRLGESSSAARSLLDVSYCIRHVLRAGDFFMIDEPELNLHPRNQRRMARLIGRLVNAGVKVFLTTHSDYVIRELNTLILLSGRTASQPRLLKELGYDVLELIPALGVRFYRTDVSLRRVGGTQRRKRVTVLEQREVSETTGIEVASFDEEIDELARVQDAILYTPDTKTTNRADE